jgi:hypothetical protein
LRVGDKGLALEFVKSLGWTEAIKTTEEFQISLLSAEQKEEITKGIEFDGANGFVVLEDSEVCDIKTGVGK